MPTAISYLVPGIRQFPLWTIGGWQVYVSEIAIGVGAAFVITLINLFGVKLAAAVQAIVTVVILFAGILLATGALFSPLQSVELPRFVDGATGMLGVLVMVPMMFVGFDVIPQSAEEIDLPMRQIGVLLIAAVVMAIAWYVLVIVAVAFTLDADGLAGASLATADAGARGWRTPWVGKLVVLAGIAGILSSWNAFVVGGSRAILCAGPLRHVAAAVRAIAPSSQNTVCSGPVDRNAGSHSPFFRANDDGLVCRCGQFCGRHRLLVRCDFVSGLASPRTRYATPVSGSRRESRGSGRDSAMCLACAAVPAVESGCVDLAL